MDPYGPSFAALKTVCGALLKRPGCVRFQPIPARFGGSER